MYGDFFFIPPANITVIVEAWGAGGQGRIGQNPWTGMGGGGGAYAWRNGIRLLAGVTYDLRVGAPGGIAAPHESGLYGVPPGDSVVAVEGGNAGFQTAGAGGTAAASTGAVKFSGGSGATPYPGDGQPGGGGGSSAGRFSSGNPGGFAGGGGPGGSAPAGGGPGGNGGAFNADGSAPVSGPGGGGGGGGSALAQTNGGAGFEGAIIVWQDFGIWPPAPGQMPIVQHGSPPAPPNPANPKLRKSSFIM